MSKLSTILPILASASFAVAQEVHSASGGAYTITQDLGNNIPLVSKHFDYPQLPYKADTGDGPRGTMQGYNICNSTTANQDSQCVTAFINSATDFCLWGAPDPNSVVANVEGEMVAYCTSPKYGTRTLTEGSITGLQFIQTPDYVEIVGQIDQTKLNLTSDDTGGEEDPHGADNRGNPLGSLLYSNAFHGNGSAPYVQVEQWSYFIGSGTFCFKACDPASSQAASLCQHVYDEIGCTYNDPANYAAINGTFNSCKGENQLPPGIFIDGSGQSQSYQQNDGPPTYSVSIPATSECSTITSSAVFTDMLKTATPGAPTSAGASGADPSAGSGSGAGPAATGSGASSGDDSNAAVQASTLGAGMTVAAIAASMAVLGAVIV